MDCVLYKTKNSSKVTINANLVNNSLNHASLGIKRLLWLSVFTTLEPPYWMFSRISEVGPNRKLVPSTPRLSFWTVWFRHNPGRDPFNQSSNRFYREKWSTSKGGPVFSKLFRLDRTNPLGFGPKFPGNFGWMDRAPVSVVSDRRTCNTHTPFLRICVVHLCYSWLNKQLLFSNRNEYLFFCQNVHLTWVSEESMKLTANEIHCNLDSILGGLNLSKFSSCFSPKVPWNLHIFRWQ